jgi:hypothetical protein
MQSLWIEFLNWNHEFFSSTLRPNFEIEISKFMTELVDVKIIDLIVHKSFFLDFFFFHWILCIKIVGSKFCSFCSLSFLRNAITRLSEKPNVVPFNYDPYQRFLMRISCLLVRHLSYKLTTIFFQVSLIWFLGSQIFLLYDVYAWTSKIYSTLNPHLLFIFGFVELIL